MEAGGLLMVIVRETLAQAFDALRAHKLRAALTILGLTMGVATLITVMTIVQGANLYVEQKIITLGTDVFQVQRMPFAVTDVSLVIKALKRKYITMDDLGAVAERCVHCEHVGGQANFGSLVRFGDKELQDTNIVGQTASMAGIDNRTVEQGRYFTEIEDSRNAQVAVIGSRIVDEFFPGRDPLGRTIRIGDEEFIVIGVFERIGAVLGQEQDNFAVIPMGAYRRVRGSRFSVTINVRAPGEVRFERALDETRLILRGRRHVRPGEEDDFFVSTKESYIELWRNISSAFFAVFIMVSSISAVVGGIVIMNVMLVSVTERTKEIGVRRAVGASRRDILRQFLTESVMQCLVGGVVGVAAGFAVALLLSRFTSFPASVQAWVVVLGLVLSSTIGLFFGIYPATRAARLDPVVALRSE
jgi:putative ABC transport system permease protein